MESLSFEIAQLLLTVLLFLSEFTQYNLLIFLCSWLNTGRHHSTGVTHVLRLLLDFRKGLTGLVKT